MNNKAFNDFINLDYKSFSDLLFSLSPFEFSLLGSILGLYISVPLTINEQNSLGNFLELVGQVILTYNAQAEGKAPQPVTTTDLNCLRKELMDQLNFFMKQRKK